MLRVLLTAYFAAATVPGPWLCCCLIESARCCKARPAESCCVETPCRRCCGDRAPCPEPNPNRKEAPCPCKYGDRPVAMPADGGPRFDGVAADAVAILDAFPAADHVVAAVALVSRREDPFAENVRTRLGLLCVLRC
jgi:hypothetical protein